MLKKLNVFADVQLNSPLTVSLKRSVQAGPSSPLRMRRKLLPQTAAAVIRQRRATGEN